MSGLVVIVGGLILAPACAPSHPCSPDQRGTASLLVVITAVGVAVQLPATAAASVLRAMNRYDLMNLIGSLAVAEHWGIDRHRAGTRRQGYLDGRHRAAA